MSAGNNIPKEVYHYTDQNSANEIIKSGHIRQSDPMNGDAAFGIGTYLTATHPSESKDDVLMNNYDGMIDIDKSKADVAFGVPYDEDKMKKVDTERNVYLYEGDIPLDKNTKIYDNSTGKTYQLPK